MISPLPRASLLKLLPEYIMEARPLLFARILLLLADLAFLLPVS